MPAARCILCSRLLMVARPESQNAVANPDALVLCAVCHALPTDQRQRRRGEVMVRMLDETIRHPQRRHA